MRFIRGNNNSILKSFTGRLLLAVLIFISFCTIGYAKDEIVVSVSSDAEITIEHFPAAGEYLLIWLAPEYGFRPSHRTLSQALAEQDIEVWMGDIAESLYLPQSLKSLKQLDGNYVADLIEYAHTFTGKKIIVAGDSYGAINVLQGVYQWQQRKHRQAYLIGSVLFTPNAYASIPSLGLQPEYMPVISATNSPVMIFQATGNANAGQFQALKETLQINSDAVYSKFMTDIMGLFYEEAPTQEIKKHLQTLPHMIKKMIIVLERHKLPENTIPVKNNKVRKSGIDRHLKEYKGNNVPYTIDLNDVYGTRVIKDNFRGQVTVVNFWATWCPPCVEEIPSLNRFKNEMVAFPVELISINYAEDSQTIIDFMAKIKVEFPVLLDKNGEFAKKWHVITYPSTFVIDKQGQIKYGVNAAIEWDDPELIKIIKSLL